MSLLLNAALSPETITWETSTDWDNAVSEAGVVHADTANTDHNDAGTLQMGYPYDISLITPTPLGAWPQHEDSGSTAHDLSDGYDGTVTGGTGQGNTGILGTTSYQYEPAGGSDADVEISRSGDLDPSNMGDTFTFTQWVYTNNFTTSTWQNVLTIGGGGNDVMGLKSGRNSGNWELYLDASNSNIGHVESNTSPTVDTWEFLALTYDGSAGEAKLYVDGSDVYTWSASGSLSGTSEDWRIGNRGEKGESWDGKITETRIYNEALTASQVQTLYDVVDQPSTLTTASKSFSEATQPDLQNLSYVLNGESITLTVIGSPGTASEETVTQTLSGATSYSLSWNNSHTDFRLKPQLSTTDKTTSPTFSRGELIG
jgi:hypothetical protein